MERTEREIRKLLKTYRWMRSARSVPLRKMEKLLYDLGCQLVQLSGSHDTYTHSLLTKAPAGYFPEIVLGQKEPRDVVEVVKKEPMRRDNVKRILGKVSVIIRMLGVADEDL